MADKYIWRIVVGEPDSYGVDTACMAKELSDRLGVMAEIDYLVRPFCGNDTTIVGIKEHEFWDECIDEMKKYVTFISKYGPISYMTVEALHR